MLTPLSKAGQLWSVSQSEADNEHRGKYYCGITQDVDNETVAPRDERQRDRAGPGPPGVSQAWVPGPQPGPTCQSPRLAERPLPPRWLPGVQSAP